MREIARATKTTTQMLELQSELEQASEKPAAAENSPRLHANNEGVLRTCIGSLPETPCRKNRNVDPFAGPIDGPATLSQSAIVVKSVDVVPSKRQRVSPSRDANQLKLNGKQNRVSTGDPHCPRRMEESCKSSAFSTTCGSRSWSRAVETCGAL